MIVFRDGDQQVAVPTEVVVTELVTMLQPLQVVELFDRVKRAQGKGLTICTVTLNRIVRPA